LDEGVRPTTNNCNVLSFGINHDYSFDKEIMEKYGCNIYSFDLKVETALFKKIRKSNQSLENSVEIQVNEKWKFYKLGINGTATEAADLSQLSRGSLLNLADILKLTKLENKVIDVFKMDIEKAEKQVFKTFDMNFACKYIKQLVFETHRNMEFNELKKLEECFLLFHRDTRFFKRGRHPLYGAITEFQDPDGFKLDLKRFGNELKLAAYMFVTGELYFLNRNFLKDF
jgi:hypothetical protein